MFGGGVGVPALMATIAPRPIKQRIASHAVLITANPHIVRICELIVSVGLNPALKGRTGRETRDIVEEFRTRVNEWEELLRRWFALNLEP